MKRNKIMTDWYERLTKAYKCAPRIVSYDNVLDEVMIRRHKGYVYLLLSVNPEGLKLTDLGYDDKWSKKRKVIEQFEIKLTAKQAHTLSKDILKKLMKINKEALQ